MRTQTPNLNKALSNAKVEFPTVHASKNVDFKTTTGRNIKFMYAELEEIVGLITPVLSKHGLAIAHEPGYHEISDHWYSQNFEVAADMLNLEQMDKVIRAISKAYATEKNNVGAISAINDMLEQIRSGAKLKDALSSWLKIFFGVNKSATEMQYAHS